MEVVVAVAVLASVIFGVLDYRLDELTQSKTTARDTISIASKVLVVSGIAGAVMLLALDGITPAALPSQGEVVVGVLLMLGWICTMYCVAYAGLIGRAMIHWSIVVAIAIAVAYGATLTWPTVVSMVILIASTASTVWFYLKDNPRITKSVHTK